MRSAVSGDRRAGFERWRGGRSLRLVLLLLAALVFRAAIPTGWMPDLQGASGAPLVICTGSGSEVLRLDKGGVPAGPHSAGHHDVCAFASLAGAPAAPALVLGAAPRFALALRQDPPAETLPRPPLRHREQAARAPPIRV
jgi:hypothetical protein